MRGLMIRQIRSARIVMLVVTCVYYKAIAWHSAPFESGTGLIFKFERQRPEPNRCLGAISVRPLPLAYALRDVNVANSRHTLGAF